MLESPQVFADGDGPFITAPLEYVHELLSYFIEKGIPCTRRKENDQNVIRFPTAEGLGRIMSLLRDWEKQQLDKTMILHYSASGTRPTHQDNGG